MATVIKVVALSGSITKATPRPMTPIRYCSGLWWQGRRGRRGRDPGIYWRRRGLEEGEGDRLSYGASVRNWCMDTPATYDFNNPTI